MDNFENKESKNRERDILFSKSVLAGKRIYYLDVKKNRKGELFLNITESKKVLSKDSAQPEVRFEKHKIFLYREDFDHFLNALNETIAYAKENNADNDFVSGADPDTDTENFLDPINLIIDF